MKDFVIVWNDTLEIAPGFYSAEEPDYGRFGGPMGSPSQTAHLPVPNGLDSQCLMAVKNVDGNIILQEDPQKVQAKIDAVWASLRAERNALLAASDWTQLQDARLSLEKKQAWVDYRQALRDLPETVTDPMAVVWPLAP